MLGGKPSALRPETYRAGQPGEIDYSRTVSLALAVGYPLRPEPSTMIARAAVTFGSGLPVIKCSRAATGVYSREHVHR